MRSAAAFARAAAAVAVLVLSGCDRGGLRLSRPQSTSADSSFAAVTFVRGRSPRQLSEVGGQVIYQHYCVICHGDSGEGDGFNAYNVKAAFGVTPTAFADSGFVRVPEAEVLTAIRDGGRAVARSAAMPAWGHTLTPGEIEDVARYVRSLAHSTHAH